MKFPLSLRKRKQVGIIVLLCLLCSVGAGQYKVSSALFKHPRSFEQQSLIVRDDSLSRDTTDSPKNFKSTTTAILLSAAVPGAGQIYTGRYWKVPIILGFGGYFLSMWMKMDNHYRELRDAYSASIADGVYKGQGDPRLQYERDFYRDERDRFGFYIVLTYLLNIVDAYVGASLYDFDVGDNLGGTSVRIRMPIR
jgi:hypothetical protein